MFEDDLMLDLILIFLTGGLWFFIIIIKDLYVFYKSL